MEEEADRQEPPDREKGWKHCLLSMTWQSPVSTLQLCPLALVPHESGPPSRQAVGAGRGSWAPTTADVLVSSSFKEKRKHSIHLCAHW